jgi:hypothetical protein
VLEVDHRPDPASRSTTGLMNRLSGKTKRKAIRCAKRYLTELVAVGVDERDYLLCWRSSSAPKEVAARF